ncbi:MAG TPA: hypothetical protein VMX17_12355 [Candidatus Glassbacteria bacterium]|nr:hypothetical protein [Candidatus Glassbacteria bacterium]
MEEGLMFGCINWGADKCHEEVAEWKFAKNVGEGESIPIWPATGGEEQKKLDDICKTCPYFKIQPK